jgi:hypothetical protein
MPPSPIDHDVALAAHEHQLVARLRSGNDQTDSQALADAVEVAMDAQLDLLDHGMGRARGSAARAEVVGIYVELFSSIAVPRIRRRFGK